ncbi:MAG: response regulator [Phenylobacterium sp.]|jgi:PAS domain S-box-containing protein|nr:response regulator [Phenylobacterium sp.]
MNTRTSLPLRQSLEAVLEEMPVGVILASVPSGELILYNRRAEEILGHSVLGRVADEYDTYGGVHPDGRPYSAEEYPTARAVLHGETIADHPMRYRRPDGTFVELLISARRIETANGLVAVCTFEDVSELRGVQASLQALNAELERRVADALAERKIFADIVESTDAFIQAADFEFRWLAINDASASEFERIFGVRPKVGDSMLDVLRDKPEHQAAVREVWARALAGEEFTEIDEFGDPSLDRRYYEMNFNTLRNDAGEAIGAFQVVYDVTDRLRRQNELEQTQAALREAQKLEAMGQLTGGVAHDFNNLLMPILGGLDILQRSSRLSPRERKLLDGAIQSAERAKALVQRLLAFARRQPLQAGPVDVAAAIQAMGELIGSTTGPQISVSIDTPPILPPAHVDANQLEMAILNLAVNARDAMPTGGTLRLSATAEWVAAGHRAGLAPGNYVCISVSDTGEGMDEATRARAVEPFFSTKGLGRGTGLGLSMVHGLVAQCGGGLHISSRVGLGTNVEMFLPVSHGQRQPTLPSEETAVGPAHGRVLLVDDDPGVRATTRNMLEMLGYEVLEAASGPEALEVMGSHASVDALVTDHLMPDMTGDALSRIVRRRWPSTGVLIVSGYAEAEGLAPDLAHLAKPFRIDELARALRAVSSVHPSKG